MSIFEYDEEKHIKNEREEWREVGREEGREEGFTIGREEGCNSLAFMLKSLLDAGKTEEIQRSLSDSAYREELYQKYLADNE